MLENEKRTIALMESNQIDTLIATSPENILYTTEFWSFSQWVLKAQVFALLSRERSIAPIIIAPMADMDLAVETSRTNEDIVHYGKYYFSKHKTLTGQDKQLAQLLTSEDGPVPIEVLERVIKQRKLDRGTIGIDESAITPFAFKYLEKHLPNTKFIQSSNLFREIRMVKTQEEIQRLQTAVEITEKAMISAVAIAKEGITEREMAREFELHLIRNDATPVLTCIGFSNRAAYPNVLPSDKKLKRGDILRFDIGCRYKHYCSDIARTFVFGKVTTKQERLYKALVGGEQSALDKIRAGIKVNEIFNAAVEAVRKLGIEDYARHHCGHGIGLELYDMPSVSRDSDIELQAGTVLCIETPYIELGSGGLQVEDELLVLDKGYKLMTNTFRGLNSL